MSALRQTVRHAEPVICSDPYNGQRMVAASMYSSNLPPMSPYNHSLHRNTVVYFTADGGRTWSLGLDLPRSADPACAFGADGRVYYSAMQFPEYDDIRTATIPIFESRDGGRRWNRLGEIDKGEFLDRQWMFVEHSPGRTRRLLVSAMGLKRSPPSGVELSTYLFLHDSVTGGITTTARQPLEGAIHNGGIGSFPDGTIIASQFYAPPRERAEVENSECVPASRRGELRVVRTATDAPLQTITVTDGLWSYPCHKLPAVDQIPALAVDSSSAAFRDSVYVVWLDKKSGRVEVRFSFSRDKGLTWSAPRTVNDDVSFDEEQPWLGPHHLNPSIAVNAEGVLAILWYDRRDHRERGYMPRVTASLDGGETWMRSVPVSGTPYTERPSWQWYVDRIGLRSADTDRNRPVRISYGVPPGLDRTGDTSGLSASADGAFYGAWIDDRTGVPQIRAARIEVAGSVRVARDVTERATVLLESIAPSCQANSIEIGVMVANTSSTALRGPIILDVLRNPAEGSVGTDAVNADNGRPRQGAAWRVAEAGVTLRQGEKTPTRKLVFRCDSYRPVPKLLDLDLRILSSM